MRFEIEVILKRRAGRPLLAMANGEDDDDTWADFTAVKVSAADIDSLVELANYDVVILGDSGTRDHDWTSDMSNALRDWVNAGGSAVLTGWGSYGMDTSNAIYDPLDFLIKRSTI